MSKINKRQCNAHAVKGKTKCRMHGGSSPMRGGAYTNITKENELLKMKIDIDDKDIKDPIKIIRKQLKMALVRQERLADFQRIYELERGKNIEKGLELNELKQVTMEPDEGAKELDELKKKQSVGGREVTTVHRIRDYSMELNTIAKMIVKFTQQIEDIKNKKKESTADKVVFDIKFGGEKCEK